MKDEILVCRCFIHNIKILEKNEAINYMINTIIVNLLVIKLKEFNLTLYYCIYDLLHGLSTC